MLTHPRWLARPAYVSVLQGVAEASYRCHQNGKTQEPCVGNHDTGLSPTDARKRACACATCQHAILDIIDKC